VNLGSSFLESGEIDNLCQAARSIFETIPSDHPAAIRDDGVTGVLNLPLYDNRVTNFVDKIVSDRRFQAFLSVILGEGCRIWDISLRRSNPGNKGLYLHQDGVGQVNMAICLDDNQEGIGATALLPSSHLVARSIRDLRAEVPPIVVNWLSFLFVPLAGKKGDVIFFSNRAWHGRFANLSDTTHDVILIGFFPKGYRYSHHWPKNLIETCQGKELGKLLASEKDFEGAITSNCECREDSKAFFSDQHGYSMDIEKPDFLCNAQRTPILLTSVAILRFIMLLGRSTQSLRRILRPRKRAIK
jgi:putative 2OG-Fe(II) oxygenase